MEMMEGVLEELIFFKKIIHCCTRAGLCTDVLFRCNVHILDTIGIITEM